MIIVEWKQDKVPAVFCVTWTFPATLEKEKKRWDEASEHDGTYLTCGVSQEVTYVGDNFTERQALSSVSGRQE